MESITLAGQRKDDGCVIRDAQLYAVGAVREPTKATKDKPEAERKYYYVLHLRSDPDEGYVLWAFCDQDHAATVADAIRDAQAPVLGTFDLSMTRDSVNVRGVKVEG
jgi:hypothetical protein